MLSFFVTLIVVKDVIVASNEGTRQKYSFLMR